MRTREEQRQLLDRVVDDAKQYGVALCSAEDEQTTGRRIRIRGRDLVNFGSCSYLGLELDPRLIEGAVRATRSHGIETSSSRVYVSSPLYTEFEELVEQMFRAHVVVTPTTTLGHLAALPALVEEEDAIIMDHQVHTSVQVASTFVHASGTHLEVVPHNDLARLEERVEALSREHRNVWYMADGVYSMFGDFAPTAEISAMLDRHEQMRFYVDDAHGMSWSGPRGTGTVLNRIELHPQMVLATGLAKGFGTGGGLIVLPDEESKRRVRRWGPTMLFGGPLQPPILGAAIESAKIHLSDEIDVLQAELRERMDLCNGLLAEAGLPVISSPDTPVGFLAAGPTVACQILCSRLLEEGFFTNPAQFPAAPANRSGGRFLLTRHQALEDIEALVAAMARNWEPSVREAGTTPEDVWEVFGLEPPVARRAPRSTTPAVLSLEASDTIHKLRRDEWDRMMADRGCLSMAGMTLFESVFGPGAAPENRWDFRYYVVRDRCGAPVLATCFTSALWKVDMLAPAPVSEAVEARRQGDPTFLTQRVYSMGCLLSEGEHLWLRDPVDTPTSRDAIGLLLEAVRADAESLGCEMLVLRDVPDSEPLWATRFESEGFLRMPAPESLVVSEVGESEADLVAQLGRKHRYHQSRYVAPWSEHYEIEILSEGGRSLSDDEVDQLYRLYENVRSNSLELNTYPLPKEILPAIAGSPGWELMLFRSAGDSQGDPVCFLASHLGETVYVPLFTGLDYRLVRERGLYRQMLRHAVGRARSLGRERVLFGFGASLEKRRFGAKPIASSMFVELNDAAPLAVLEEIASTLDS